MSPGDWCVVMATRAPLIVSTRYLTTPSSPARTHAHRAYAILRVPQKEKKEKKSKHKKEKKSKHKKSKKHKKSVTLQLLHSPHHAWHSHPHLLGPRLGGSPWTILTHVAPVRRARMALQGKDDVRALWTPAPRRGE